jgi:hypothetical protein
VPDQDDRTGSAQLIDHGSEIASELVDRAVFGARPRRTAVGTLVVEDHPVVAAEGEPLEVPAVEIEGVAVNEDDGRGVGGARGVDLGIQLQAVVSGDRTPLTPH